MQISHSTLFSAPTGIVWRVTADVAQWPEWSPTITSISGWGGGDLFQDAQFDLKQPFQRRRSWVLSHCAAPHLLSLRTAEGDMTALHEIIVTESVRCNRLSLQVSGLLGRLARPFISLALQKENAALKSRCESAAATWIFPPRVLHTEITQ
ncbi:SRPBCC family protein [Rhodobacteraceae bacterium DSL-40]|uniref:SRPBCC family protein n=1 Tax=Amaricoccus sp. B4 TaxID=3368557 RepID=UPI000DAC605A